MPSRIEDYALIGDCHTGALVARDGSIDWLCLPRFDSAACFAALLGTSEHGRWLLAPAEEIRATRRRYREGTLILETEYTTGSGAVRLVDFMSPRSEAADVVRIVEGIRGQVPMRMELVIRFDYGAAVPWVRRAEDGIWATAGPDTLHLHTGVDVRGENFHSVAEFTLAERQRIPFTLTWHPSHRPEPHVQDAFQDLAETEDSWREWSERCTYRGEWRDAVLRSLVTLKALTYEPTGGIVAAATTSLPERLGGVRNWDYRFCWVRDATFTLYALMTGGYKDEARAWREWLLRAIAGRPEETQILYGLAGERRAPELEIDWLPGYESAAPVRIGNAAAKQHQLDVYGEIMDALHLERRAGLEPSENAWRVQRSIMRFLEGDWRNPDEGIWEVRGPRRHFTHSKVMAWVAADRAVKAVERYGLEGPVEHWRALRREIHDAVWREGFDTELNSFVQSFGSKLVDASLLMLPLVGFVKATDPRMVGTVAAIEKELLCDGFIARYPTVPQVDGLPPGEGAFLACTFWWADNLALQGRTREARECFERLLDLRNDVGLLSEEWDPAARRLVGNFPQAFSHVGLINTAQNLCRPEGPAEHRSAPESERRSSPQ